LDINKNDKGGKRGERGESRERVGEAGNGVGRVDREKIRGLEGLGRIFRIGGRGEGKEKGDVERKTNTLGCLLASTISPSVNHLPTRKQVQDRSLLTQNNMWPVAIQKPTRLHTEVSKSKEYPPLVHINQLFPLSTPPIPPPPRHPTPLRSKLSRSMNRYLPSDRIFRIDRYI